LTLPGLELQSTASETLSRLLLLALRFNKDYDERKGDVGHRVFLSTFLQNSGSRKSYSADILSYYSDVFSFFS
jgi:hypothetical protein